jgi:hypothetical protein
MVRFRAGGSIAGGLRHGVAQIGNIVGEVGGLAGGAFRIVLAQADSWGDRDFREGRTKAWMARVLVARLERCWRFGERSALVGELLCHGELGSGTEEAERR